MKNRLIITLLFCAIAYICNAQITSGYRGMLEGGKTFHLDNGNFHTTEFATTHGYQFNPHLFVGAGVGYHFSSDVEDINYMSMYADIRYNFIKNSISPFVDLKAGYSVFDTNGIYLNPNIGVNFNVYKMLSVYLKVGYTYQKLDDIFIYYQNGDTYKYIGGITAKIGFEF